jgi:hypothetical protein
MGRHLLQQVNSPEHVNREVIQQQKEGMAQTTEGKAHAGYTEHRGIEYKRQAGRTPTGTQEFQAEQAVICCSSR